MRLLLLSMLFHLLGIIRGDVNIEELRIPNNYQIKYRIVQTGSPNRYAIETKFKDTFVYQEGPKSDEFDIIAYLHVPDYVVYDKTKKSCSRTFSVGSIGLINNIIKIEYFHPNNLTFITPTSSVSFEKNLQDFYLPKQFSGFQLSPNQNADVISVNYDELPDGYTLFDQIPIDIYCGELEKEIYQLKRANYKVQKKINLNTVEMLEVYGQRPDDTQVVFGQVKKRLGMPSRNLIYNIDSTGSCNENILNNFDINNPKLQIYDLIDKSWHESIFPKIQVSRLYMFPKLVDSNSIYVQKYIINTPINVDILFDKYQGVTMDIEKNTMNNEYIQITIYDASTVIKYIFKINREDKSAKEIESIMSRCQPQYVQFDMYSKKIELTPSLIINPQEHEDIRNAIASGLSESGNIVSLVRVSDILLKYDEYYQILNMKFKLYDDYINSKKYRLIPSQASKSFDNLFKITTRDLITCMTECSSIEKCDGFMIDANECIGFSGVDLTSSATSTVYLYMPYDKELDNVKAEKYMENGDKSIVINYQSKDISLQTLKKLIIPPKKSNAEALTMGHMLFLTILLFF